MGGPLGAALAVLVAETWGIRVLFALGGGISIGLLLISLKYTFSCSLESIEESTYGEFNQANPAITGRFNALHNPLLDQVLDHLAGTSRRDLHYVTKTSYLAGILIV